MKTVVMEEQKLGSEPISKLLFKMSVPMILAMVINGMYYLADAIFVGWGVGSEALGGLAVVFPLQMLAIAIGMAIGTGTASIESIELGNQRKDKVAKIIKTSVIFSLILGILLPLILIVFKKEIIYFFGATENIYPHAEGYYTYIVYGFVFIFLSFLEINIIKAEGNAKLAALGMFLGAFLNVILDAIFIFVFHMGTAGAALATVIALEQVLQNDFVEYDDNAYVTKNPQVKAVRTKDATLQFKSLGRDSSIRRIPSLMSLSRFDSGASPFFLSPVSFPRPAPRRPRSSSGVLGLRRSFARNFSSVHPTRSSSISHLSLSAALKIYDRHLLR